MLFDSYLLPTAATFFESTATSYIRQLWQVYFAPFLHHIIDITMARGLIEGNFLFSPVARVFSGIHSLDRPLLIAHGS